MVAPSFWNRFRMNERWEITGEGNPLSEEFLSVEAKFYRNDFQVYSFKAPTMRDALLRVGELYSRLKYIVNIRDRKDVHEDILGRAVYYREFPAIIADFDGEKGRVMLRSDFPLPRINTGFPPEPWDGDEEPKCSQDIWEDLLSPKIHWHRSEAE